MSASSARNPDLHCHSTVSDGTLAPAALAQRAHANGVDLWALTDHDELGGLAEARQSAEALGLRFVPGVEISVSFAAQTVHIVALNFDASHPVLQGGLQQIRAGRDQRARDMAADLEKHLGLSDVYAGALRHAGNPALMSRTHFARLLVELGVCRQTHEVFSRYLTPGKPGYVEHEWARLDEALSWVRAAGGITVIAHPGRYRFTETEEWALLERFKSQGGQGIEVVTGSHTAAQARKYAKLALEFGFYASRGSDFHSPRESICDLGRLAPLPADLAPVWDLLH
jgi:predicted metal-dependent phosphoesterase TrpH